MAGMKEVRDIEMVVLTALDFMPFANPKFCQMFGFELQPLFTDDEWRSKDGN